MNDQEKKGMSEEQKGMSEEQKEYHKSYFHQFAKIAYVENIDQFGKSTSFEQEECRICGSPQTISQLRRKRKTCGDKECIKEAKNTTRKNNRGFLFK